MFIIFASQSLYPPRLGRLVEAGPPTGGVGGCLKQNQRSLSIINPHFLRIKEVIIMNKAELIEQLATKTGAASKAEVGRWVDTFVDMIINTLKKGDEVAIAGFGTFSVRSRAARTGRNPKTGETISIAATKVPKFKAGKGFKEAVK